MSNYNNKEFVKRYRFKDDENRNSEGRYKRCGTVKEITGSFTNKISVLDLGCGTGRYFHCLQNTKLLVGVDKSYYMLMEALNPMDNGLENIKKTSFIKGDLFNIEFEEESFEFIYSIGVVAEQCDLTLEFCNRVCSWLKKDCCFYFTAKKGNEGHAISFTELNIILNESKFSYYNIFEFEDKPPGWAGVHYECVAYK